MISTLLLGCLLAADVVAVPVDDGPHGEFARLDRYYGDKEHPPTEHLRLPFGAGLAKDVVGVFPYDFDPQKPRTFVETRVAEVIDKSTLLITVTIYGWERRINGTVIGPARPVVRAEKIIIVSGTNTDDIADDDKLLFPGGFRVTGTRKYGSRTVHVVEPIRLPELKRKDREAE